MDTAFGASLLAEPVEKTSKFLSDRSLGKVELDKAHVIPSCRTSPIYQDLILRREQMPKGTTRTSQKPWTSIARATPFSWRLACTTHTITSTSSSGHTPTLGMCRRDFQDAAMVPEEAGQRLVGGYWRHRHSSPVADLKSGLYEHHNAHVQWQSQG